MDVENFWNTCDTNFAHITVKGHLKNYQTLTSQWEKGFIKLFDWENKIVADYGIGAGWLGKYLFETKNINRYIGIDISNRSLEHSRNNLKNYNAQLFLTDEIDISTLDIDIFISQACIQHFPNLNYLEQFLESLNKSNCSKLMLQIAHSPTTTFNNDGYKTISQVVRACKTNKEFLQQNLNTYELEYSSDIYPNDYQFLVFRKRKDFI